MVIDEQYAHREPPEEAMLVPDPASGLVRTVDPRVQWPGAPRASRIRAGTSTDEEVAMHTISTTLETQEVAQAATLGVLDALDVGLMLVAADGRLQFGNRASLRACGSAGPLRITGGRVSLLDAGAQDGFHRALRRAVEGQRTLLRTEGQGCERYVALAPVPSANGRESGGAGEGAARAIVLIGRPQPCNPLCLQLFAGEHGITSAETRVLAALCEGRSPREISLERGIALSTVRTQIACLLAKTGVDSIVDLVRMTATLPPMVALAA
jgi:DNA-binding CsgD family transcriptional regulator